MCASHKSLNLNKKNDLKSAVTLTNNITHITQTDSAFLPSANDAVWNVKSINCSATQSVYTHNIYLLLLESPPVARMFSLSTTMQLSLRGLL